MYLRTWPMLRAVYWTLKFVLRDAIGDLRWRLKGYPVLIWFTCHLRRFPSMWRSFERDKHNDMVSIWRYAGFPSE